MPCHTKKSITEEKLKQYLESHPYYTGNGIATYNSQDKILHTYEDWLIEFKRDSMPLLDTVNICYNWFAKYNYEAFCETSNRIPSVRITKQHLHSFASTTYGLKHVIEDMEETYVPNISCIIAADLSHIPLYYSTNKKIKRDYSNPAPKTEFCTSPNLFFKKHKIRYDEYNTPVEFFNLLDILR